MEATKQKDGELCRDAPGYHTKSTMGAGCGNVLTCVGDNAASVGVDVDAAGLDTSKHKLEGG